MLSSINPWDGPLSLCMLGKMLLLSSADFFQNKVFQKILSETRSDCPDQDQQDISPDLGSNFLQTSSADDKSCC